MCIELVVQFVGVLQLNSTGKQSIRNRALTGKNVVTPPARLPDPGLRASLAVRLEHRAGRFLSSRLL